MRSETLRLEAASRRSRGRPARRFMDVVKEDMELIGVGEVGEMKAGDWLWPPRKEKGRRR